MLRQRNIDRRGDDEFGEDLVERNVGWEGGLAQLLKKADEGRGEGVIAQFAPIYPLVLAAPQGVGLEFGGVDGDVKYLVGEPVLKAENRGRKA